MGELSERQAEILAFISRHSRENGYPPTVREIGLAVGLASPSTVHAHLAKLEGEGYIQRDPSKPRAMFVCSSDVAPSRPDGALPLVGAVAAGLPRLAEEHVEDWVTAPFPGDFLLRVTGDSMVGAGILDGDLVAVRRQESAENGEIVVAQIAESAEEHEATVKTLRREDGRAVLQPENDAYPPIPADDAAIVGKVVGVMRSL
jgi:repressor LexA